MLIRTVPVCPAGRWERLAQTRASDGITGSGCIPALIASARPFAANSTALRADELRPACCVTGFVGSGDILQAGWLNPVVTRRRRIAHDDLSS
jgi:hypothetical protein